MAYDNAPSNLLLSDAKIIWRNFEGRETKFNRLGDRNFHVIIEDPELADSLIEDGWNVKKYIPENGDPFDHLKVTVSFKNSYRIPKIFLHTSKNKTLLDEDTVKAVDTAEIKKADMTIRPYVWEVNGRTGIAAYLKVAHIFIEEDEWEDRYAEEEYPFE